MNKILVILGPTASGKSDLAVILAKKYNGEIISADSRQVYTGLDIGTGKITKKEMKDVTHHMLDVVSPKKTFTVAQWQKQTEKIIQEIHLKNKLPIICGGTGLYVQSIVDGLVLPEVPPNIKLRASLVKVGPSQLFEELKKLDLERARNIDANNKVRLIRAIEIAKALGKVPEIIKKESPFEILQIGLRVGSKDLKNKIQKRIILRMKKGMVSEAKKLHKNGLSFKRMSELGLEYRLLSSLLQKNITEKEFVEKLEKEIWQYTKRQNTWFKRDKSIKWYSPDSGAKIDGKVAKFLNVEK